MKLTKKLITVLILAAALLSIGVFPAFADGLQWPYNENNRTLTITGQGSMQDYSGENAWEAPWAALSGYVDTLRIESGITRIGDWSFLSLVSLEPGRGVKSLYLPASVTELGEGAFEFFFDLTDVYYEGNPDAWERLLAGNDSEFLTHASFHSLSAQSQYAVSSGKELSFPDWKSAYRSILEDAQINGSGGESDSELHSYTLYDIDKNGIPELILHFGTTTAASHGRLYAYSGNGATLLKEFGYGGNFFASYPEGNGVLFSHARMGGQTVKLWMLMNGRIIESEELFTETLEGRLQYTDISDIIQGATNLTEFPGDTLYPLACYEKWAEYLLPTKQAVIREERFPQNNPDFYKNVILDLTPVVPCWVSMEYDSIWKESFSAGNSYSSVVSGAVITGAMYRSVPENILDTGSQVIRYADLNGDGQLEAVCSYLLPLNADNYIQFSVILSEQSGTVYAYMLMSVAVTDVAPEGILYYYFRDPMYAVDVHTEYAFKLYFDREQAFFTRVPFVLYSGTRMPNDG